MKTTTRRKSRLIQLNNDTLESRDLPATFGVPWPNAQHLTVSFAPDNTETKSGVNDLNTVLGSQFGASLGTGAAAQAAWKSAILKAFSVWSSQAGINFTGVSDSGAAFGTSGQITSDSRFGDIRVGGAKLSGNAMAITVPYDPSAAGTLSGDVMLNTNDNFNDGNDLLYRVALHEVGHVLGLDHSDTVGSVMSAKVSPSVDLSSIDILAIQSLYGSRTADAFDAAASNDTLAASSTVSSVGHKPILLFGDITTANDVDVYDFRVPVQNAGSASIRLQTAGVSLLNAKITVLDSAGQQVGQATVDQLGGGSAVVTLNSPTPGGKYFVRVESLPGNSFQVGAYGLSISMDGYTEVSQSKIASVLSGSNLSMSSAQLQTLLTQDGGTGSDNGSNADTLKLISNAGYQSNQSYSTISNFGNNKDTDQFKIAGSSGRGSVVTVRIDSLGDTPLNPSLQLTDKNGHVIPSKVLLNNDGQMTIQAVGINSAESIYVKAQSDDGQTGSYRLDVTFGTAAKTMNDKLNGQVSASSPSQCFKFYVAQPQIFQFTSLVQSQSGNSGGRVGYSIINASGQVVWTLNAGSDGSKTGDSVLLNNGEYRIQVTYQGGSPSNEPLSFRLSSDVVSDPIGPVGIDGTTFPQYTDPGIPGIYLYPGGVVIDEAYYIIVIPDPNYDPYGNLDSTGWIA